MHFERVTTTYIHVDAWSLESHELRIQLRMVPVELFGVLVPLDGVQSFPTQLEQAA